ncbi:hypothetical protein [Halomarina oriensis]|uniref:Uncharacterized protein n=1 Tax=Halomarina oriensis TaxID=671145 RepID=A0A6B0GEA3_9EURY|nr:hypothetical protein [Halomarina oriensis]MWG33142.1 hypothetical protein [Halomarina oriensis]
MSPSLAERLRDDDRGVGYQLVLMLIAFAFIALILSMMTTPITKVQNFSDDQNDGTEYEQEAATMNQRITDAWNALPVVGTFLVVVFTIVMAVVLSARA